MAKDKSKLQERISSGKSVLIVEIKPSTDGNPNQLSALARQYKNKVCALGISDNRDEIAMSALAASTLVAAEGIEPILHIVTRDRNRIALLSECLGARALGIRNILCTTGTHQTLGNFKSAKNVFDIDSIQFLQAVSELTDSKTANFCLGAVASPYADPLEMQVMRLKKKVAAGAQFMITQPIFDLDRFNTWWENAAKNKIPQKCAVIAGIKILTDAVKAKQYAEKRPLPMVPEKIMNQWAKKKDKKSQREFGIKTALETIKDLSKIKDLKGFEISCETDNDAVLEVIEKSGLGDQ